MPPEELGIRSFTTRSGGRTTIKLEVDFWEMLDQIAKHQERTTQAVISDIERMGGRANRASAIRVYVLRHLRERLGGGLGIPGLEHRLHDGIGGLLPDGDEDGSSPQAAMQ